MSMHFLSQTILSNKFNTFFILTKHLLHTVANTFAVWGAAAKLACFFFFSFLMVSQIEDLVLP